MPGVNQIPLTPDNTYHIYNRANADDLLFTSDENYLYFLKKYNHYITPLVDTFCYCLMPNHFHFLIRVKDEKAIEECMHFKMQKNQTLQGFRKAQISDETLKVSENLEGFISQQFGNFFNAYTKAYNKKHNRRGSLFMHNFKRKLVSDEQYLKKLVHYIHYNPVEAGIVSKPEKWKFSSYKAMISKQDTKLLKDDVINWFGDLQNFKYCHQKPPHLTGINRLG